MATLLSLRRRIRAAQNVSKTTRAMQMIAASKLKRAQEATLASRPYVQKLTVLAQDLAARIDESKKHPYMKPATDNGKTLLLVLSPDKGLCGGMITNLLREFTHFVKAEHNTSFIVVGKKLENQVVRVDSDILAAFPFGTTLPTFDMVFPLVKLIDEYYLSGKVENVKVLSTDFTNFFSQTPKITQVLPIALPEVTEEHKQESLMLYEPSVDEMMPALAKHYLEMSLYQFLLESFLSEQAARMIAMQNATNNAKDIIEGLRLEYNKTRQAKITSELLDITGGRSVHHG
jgi:F-type H+-transporting ATPase subunit gamma